MEFALLRVQKKLCDVSKKWNRPRWEKVQPGKECNRKKVTFGKDPENEKGQRGTSV